MNMRARIRDRQLAELARLQAAGLVDVGKIEIERMRLGCEKNGS